MRVLIMSDMEGVSGIVAHRGEQVNGGAPMYEEGLRTGYGYNGDGRDNERSAQ
jgi:D-aminopeptidase